MTLMSTLATTVLDLDVNVDAGADIHYVLPPLPFQSLHMHFSQDHLRFLSFGFHYIFLLCPFNFLIIELF